MDLNHTYESMPEESSDGGTTEFDGEYHRNRSPLPEDYYNRNIIIVRPTDFTEDRQNVSINNSTITSTSDEDIIDVEDVDVCELKKYRRNKHIQTAIRNIWLARLIEIQRRKSFVGLIIIFIIVFVYVSAFMRNQSVMIHSKGKSIECKCLKVEF